MNKRIAKTKLGRTKSHREALIRNQVRSVFTHGYIVTTTPKAKALKQELNSFLDKCQETNLGVSRKMHSVLGKKELVKIAREYLDKGDSKVSIVKVSFRDGDSGETSKVILMGYEKLFGKKKEQKDQKGKVEKEGTVHEETKKGYNESQEKGLMSKINKNLKSKLVSKERARSRSGL